MFPSTNRDLPSLFHRRSTFCLLLILDTVVAGKESKDKIDWDDNLLSHFSEAQEILKSNRSITLEGGRQGGRERLLPTMNGPPSVIRTDLAPGFAALVTSYWQNIALALRLDRLRTLTKNQ